MLDWGDWRVFLAVARSGTLTAAARQLGVDQSTVSRRLAALESAANATLFERMRDGYVLSAAGAAVMPAVQELEERALGVERALAGGDTELVGRVRLATSDSFVVWFLAERLPAFRRAFPTLILELVTGNTARDLGRREADLSLRFTKPEQPQLLARRLARVAWAVYASASYLKRRGVPSGATHFDGHDVLHYDGELASTLGGRWLREQASRGTCALTSNSLLCQAAAVSAGLGLSALPCLVGDREASWRRVAPGLIGTQELWLVVHPDVRNNARVRATMDFLTQQVSAEAAWLAGGRGKSSKHALRHKEHSTPKHKLR
ncbi:MAG: LysR family transcriptional regulator [Polyangiaceae bacterium]